MAWPLRRYFRLLWWTLCLLTFLALPLTIWEFQKQHYNVHYQAWFIGGIFVILSMPISIYEIAMHTEYYTQPRLQKHVIRILLMVPIYAVDAWFALRFQKAREYLDPIRECYEAFVIYSFFAYLMAFLQDTYGDLDEHMSKKPQMEHMWGIKYLLRPWDMGTRFLWECKKGVLNYVILRPMCTGLAFITDIFNKYGEGQINFNKSYVYLAAITNFSQLWALYCLVMLYTAMHDELAPIRPLSKFVCIKAVVFVTFWQGVGIAILVYAGVIKAESWYDRQDVASGIQDFLICIEMFLAALAHAYAFPPREYMAGHSKGFFANVRYIFDLRDVVDDVGLVVEEHVSTATTAVVKVPQRAVKKAAQGIAKNTKKLFGAAGSKGSCSRLVDEEEEAASKCALLGPASPLGAGGMSGGGSGPGSRGHSGGGGGAGPLGGWRGSSSGGSSGGGSGGSGDSEALLRSYGAGGGGASSSLRPLAAPLQHFMLYGADPAGPGGGGAASPGFGTSLHQHMPPLLPATATLGPGSASTSTVAHGSAFNSLVTSALHHTRGGMYDQAGGGGGGLVRVVRRGSVDQHSPQPAHPSGSGGSGTSEFGDVTIGGTDSAAAVAAASSGSGVELPLLAGGAGSRLHGAGTSGLSAAPSLWESSVRGSGGGAGPGSSGQTHAKGKRKTDVSAQSGRGGGGIAAELLSAGPSSGDDSSYECLPSVVSGAAKRAHDE